MNVMKLYKCPDYYLNFTNHALLYAKVAKSNNSKFIEKTLMKQKELYHTTKKIVL